MEKLEISVIINNQNQHFEINDHMHHTNGKCKYEIFKDGQFIGGLEPGTHKTLQICNNPGVVPDTTLLLIADQLKRYHI